MEMPVDIDQGKLCADFGEARWIETHHFVKVPHDYELGSGRSYGCQVCINVEDERLSWLQVSVG